MDDFIDDCFTAYSHLLVFQLKDNGYMSDKYVDKSQVIEICDLSIKCLINTFEAVVTNFITSFEDIKQFIHLYSFYQNPQQQKPKIFRQTCRYILSLIPKLNLTSKPSPKTDEYNIKELCKLIAITNLLQCFSQAKAIAQVEDSDVLSIKIGQFVMIEYFDEKIIALNESLSKSAQLIHKYYASEDDFSALMAILEKNSLTLTTIFDYVGQFVNDRADIFEVTREINNCNDDPIILGLTFSSENVNLLESIRNPYESFYRTRFRPILQCHIDGETRYFTTAWLFCEALDEISNNLIPYGEYPIEWRHVHEIKLFSKLSKEKLGKNFEDEVFKIISPSYIVKRNISGFHNISLKKQLAPNSNRKIGEIDFILIDQCNKIVYIIDAKCTKTKFYFQCFAKDKSTFDKYSVKLQDKVQWVANHKDEVGKYFKTNLQEYSVLGFFVTNSLIYYHFFADFPIIPIDKVLDFIKSRDRLSVVPS